MVGGGVIAVDLVVRGHHGAGLRPLDGDLEGQQVRFAMCVGVDDRVQPVPVGLVAVQRVVLDRRDDTLLLYPIDRLGGDRRGQKRIFGEVFEVSAVTRVTRQVDCACQLHVETAAASLPTNHLARGAGQRRVEAGGQRQTGRQSGRSVTRPVAGIRDAQTRITHQQRGDAEPWNPWHITRTHRNPRRDPLIAQRPALAGPHHTDQQREALIVGHLGLDVARTDVGF